MATKRRYYINILKETDDVRKKYEKNSDNIDQGSFNELMSIWNMSYTELLKQNYPFILLPDDDIIRISIDDRNYDMPTSTLLQLVGEEEYEKITSKKEFTLEEMEETEQRKDEDLEFTQMKNKLAQIISGEYKHYESPSDNTPKELPQKETHESVFVAEDNTIQDIDADRILNMKDKNGVLTMVNTTELSIAGLTHGCGTSHTAIMIAQSLARTGKEVAYLELDNSNHMQNMSEWILGTPAEHMFPLGGVDFYFGMNYVTFAAKFKAIYDYVVIDCGIYDEESDVSDFVRAGNKIVIASGADWNLPKLEKFYKTCTFDRGHSIIYMVPFFDDIHLKPVNSVTKKNRTIGIPFEINPFEPSEQAIGLFQSTLGFTQASIEMKEQKKKRFGLF